MDPKGILEMLLLFVEQQGNCAPVILPSNSVISVCNYLFAMEICIYHEYNYNSVDGSFLFSPWQKFCFTKFLVHYLQFDEAHSILRLVHVEITETKALFIVVICRNLSIILRDHGLFNMAAGLLGSNNSMAW